MKYLFHHREHRDLVNSVFSVVKNSSFSFLSCTEMMIKKVIFYTSCLLLSGCFHTGDRNRVELVIVATRTSQRETKRRCPNRGD